MSRSRAGGALSADVELAYEDEGVPENVEGEAVLLRGPDSTLRVRGTGGGRGRWT